MYSNHQNYLLLCKNWKRTLLLHFMEVLYQKDWKVTKVWRRKKTCLLLYGLWLGAAAPKIYLIAIFELKIKWYRETTWFQRSAWKKVFGLNTSAPNPPSAPNESSPIRLYMFVLSYDPICCLCGWIHITGLVRVSITQVYHNYKCNCVNIRTQGCRTCLTRLGKMCIIVHGH